MMNAIKVFRNRIFGVKNFGKLFLIFMICLSAVSFARAAQDAGEQPGNDGNARLRDARLRAVTGEPFPDEWDPFMEMERMHEEMNRIFVDGMKRLHASSPFREIQTMRQHYMPDLDFEDGGDRYLLKMDLPGMEKDHISVEVTKENLRVSGERLQDRAESDPEPRYYHRERTFGRFDRVIPLPQNADADRVAASYEKGVLTVKVPKRLPRDELPVAPKKIQIS